ncbi:MAG: SusC/RagA family TonB-linked outer membrane protein [Candidatus Cryptobacteroides sp.]
MKTKAFRFLFAFALLLSGAVLQAQEMIVSGEVRDDATGEPVIGVNVSVKGSTKGTSTDLDGNFTLKTAPGAELVFSCIGYEDEIFRVKAGQAFVIVAMTADAVMLEETVVVGYGQQKKASSVGSISTAKGEDLEKATRVNSVSEALQGQLAGVVSINSNSKPGSDAASIFIRGKATWGSAAPLVLVDGIERDFNDVDINEVESISVLKDASATAVFGVKGANGVILLTTKRGDSGKTSVSFSANFGFKQPTTDYDWADYPVSMEMYNEAAANDGLWDNIIPESTISAWKEAYCTGNYGPYNDYFPEVDWWRQSVKNFGFSQNYNLNVRGGADKVTYFASVGYLNDGDIFNIQKQDEFDPRFWYRRYNFRSNMDFQITKTTKLSVNIAGKMSYRNQPGYRDPDGGDSYIFQPLLTTPTNLFPIMWSDGYYGSDNTGGSNIYVQMNLQGQRMYTNYQGFYDVVLNQDLGMLTPGLSVRGAVSYTSSQSKSSSVMASKIYDIADSESTKAVAVRYYRTFDYSSPMVDENGRVTYPLLTETRFPDAQIEENRPVGTSYDNFINHTRELYYEVALNYARNFKGHDVTALALFNRRVSDSGKGSSVAFSSFEEAWVGRVTYNWKQRYLAEANASYTGSEKFAPGKRFGFFPSFSVGWRVTEEPFMKNVKKKWLNNLKIRYSYGLVGSDRGAGRFNYIQLYSSGGNAQFGLDQNVSFGPIYTEGTLAYPNATWETAVKQNLGIEMTLVRNLRISVDFFDEKRKGILMSRNTVAPWIGAGLPSVNIGRTKNHGVDVEMSWTASAGQDFHYFAKLNFATSENRVVFRDDPQKLDDYLKYAGKPIGYASKYIVAGNLTSIDDIFNYSSVNITNSAQNKLDPGDFAYMDYNADGVINDKDMVAMKHVTYPLTTGSLSLGFDWKGLGFSAMFYAAADVYKEQIPQFLWDFPELNVKAQPNTLERWTVEKAGTSGVQRPAVHLDKNHYNMKGSTYSFTDHSYFRLKEVEVSYELPKKWLRAARISRLQVYVNGNNLFTFSGIDKRRDPETSGNSVYPMIKRYNTGLRLTF